MTNDVLASVREAVASTIKENGVDPASLGPTGTSATTEQVSTTETDVPAEPAAEESIIEPTTEEATEEEAIVSEKTETLPSEEFKPSAEDLAVIEKNPELKKVYRSMVKGFTEKTTNLATQLKETEEARRAVEILRKDPEAAVRSLAAVVGLKIAETPGASTTTVEKDISTRVQEKLEGRVGAEAAAVLGPLFAEVMSDVANKEIEPLKQAMKQREDEIAQENLRNGISDYKQSVKAAGGEFTDDIEKEMAKEAGKIRPAPETTLPEFLDFLYNKVVTARAKKEGTVRQVQRIRQAASTVEPQRAAKPSATTVTTITPGMNPKEATALALKQAREELAANR